MKVLLGTTKLNKAAGGVRTHVIDLAKLLKNDGLEVIVCSGGGEYVEQLEQVGIKHYVLPFEAVRRDKKQILVCVGKLLKICKENKVDIIHCHGQSVIVAANICRRLLGIPYIWTCHNSQQPSALHKIRQLGKFPAIAVSSDLKDMLIRDYGFDDSEVSVVFNGIDITEYPPVLRNERQQLREKHGIPQDAFVISDVAALNVGKGQNLLLEAVKMVKETVRDKEIVVYLAGGTNTKGDEEYAQMLAVYAEQNHIDLRMGGYQPAREVYGMSDLACIPSLIEGFSISAIEAFAMKCPVIRSSSAGSTDMSDCCYIVPIGDSEALAEKICYAVDHIEENRGIVEMAYENVKDRFTDDIMVESIIEVYESALRGK